MMCTVVVFNIRVPWKVELGNSTTKVIGWPHHRDTSLSNPDLCAIDLQLGMKTLYHKRVEVYKT